jgi:Fe-S-cluster containining protein
MEKDTVPRILAVYAEIDQRCALFQLATGLRCVQGCGACCNSSKVEAMPVEMLPAVAELFRREEAEQWHERLMTGRYDFERCLFYSPEPVVPSNGHCLMYTWRPSVCRLFGFAAFTGKHGRAEFEACRWLKAASPDLLASARKEIARGLDVPLLSQYSVQIFGQDATRLNRVVPINRAIRLAMERYALHLDMARREREGCHDPSIGTSSPPLAAA